MMEGCEALLWKEVVFFVLDGYAKQLSSYRRLLVEGG